MLTGKWIRLSTSVPALGVPIVAIVEGLAKSGHRVNAILTDMFPNPDAFDRAEVESKDERTGEIRVRGFRNSVDARNVPAELTSEIAWNRTMRIMFTALHHFKPADVRASVADAVAKWQITAFFEITQRTRFRTLFISPAGFFAMFIFVFLMRPFRWSLFFFTWMFAPIPFIFAWDGVVSCLRSYTEVEFQDLTRDLKGKPYDVKSAWVTKPVSLTEPPILCLLVLPRQAA